jgi:hypothetical protein
MELGEILCLKEGLRLTRVVFCTALVERESKSKDRHIKYNNALVASGVTVIKGHHITDHDNGKLNEKQSDVNLALSVLCDAMDNVYDLAFILTADSDQAATGRFLTDKFPHKQLVSVAPVRRRPPEKLRPYCKASFSLSIEQIERALFPGTVNGKHGLIIRPMEYDPPSGWVHPDMRTTPSKKERI